MAFGLSGISHGKRALRRTLSGSREAASKPASVPKGYLSVYVGEYEKKRYVVPVSFLNDPAFQELLNLAEQEFGYEHPMGGLTIPCSKDLFVQLTSQI